MDKMIIYQMFTRLWGGRFSSIDEASLSYIRSLGATHVWYTGLIRHSTTWKCPGCPPSLGQIVKGDAGSPYAIVDYYDVNPYLADNPQDRMSEFESLLNRTHKAGMKLVIDFVPNHVSRDYGKVGMVRKDVRPLGADDDCTVHWKSENDFFYYPGQQLKLAAPPKPGENPYYENPAKASGNIFSPSPGINDWYETVRLNYCDFHTSTWDKMLDIVRFWCLKGVDAFRCDMVELVPWQFFKWLIKSIKDEFPQVQFIAEVYDKNQYGHYVHEVGFDFLYDKSGLYDSVRSVVEGNGTARSLTWNWQFLGDLQPHMLNFLENHDEQRFASDFFGKDGSKTFAALAASLLFSKAPFMIYFGEEIGERGMDQEGFSGRDGRTTIFDWWTVDSIVRLNEFIHVGKGLGPKESSLLGRWKEALSLASKNEDFTDGLTYDLGYCNTYSSGFNPDTHFAFMRGKDGHATLVVCNFSDQVSQVDIFIPADAIAYVGMAGNERLVEGISVPACDFVTVVL